MSDVQLRKALSPVQERMHAKYEEARDTGIYSEELLAALKDMAETTLDPEAYAEARRRYLRIYKREWYDHLTEDQKPADPWHYEFVS